MASEPAVAACPTCGLVQAVDPLPPGTVAECIRCGSFLEARRSERSLEVTAALTLAALILYVPANVYPITKMYLYGAYSESTVWDGVVMATYLEQIFRRRRLETAQDIREATVEAGRRRIRPALMTAFTTFAALLPIMLATGRGADVARSMALPVFSGMLIELVSLFVVPVFYCGYMELKLNLGLADHRGAQVVGEPAGVDALLGAPVRRHRVVVALLGVRLVALGDVGVLAPQRLPAGQRQDQQRPNSRSSHPAHTPSILTRRIHDCTSG